MRSRSPRSDRFWKPPTDFDRPPLREPVIDLLADIPERLWDTPEFDFLDGDTPRQCARHASETGCSTCREQLEQLKEAL